MIAAIILAANSGKLVHIATIVTQINDIGSHKFVAILTAASTISFQPNINHINQSTIYIIDFNFEYSIIVSHSFLISFISSTSFISLEIE
ncbi:MAG: hypothetical protein Q8S84_08675 [bacterium]|nr:hypothetical protein [bacterium]MDP3381503.1 hypothetical protein [bacterium]